MTWLIRNPLLALLLALAFLAGVFRIRSVWLAGELEKAEARGRELESYRKGRTEADEVDENIGGDPAAAREYLRNRKP